MSHPLAPNRAPWLMLGLALAAALITADLIGPDLLRLAEPPAPGYDVERLRLLYSSLPRLVTALLAGAALALSGVLLQQVLRNPLASPTTLGISAGAHLALAAATLYAPGLIAFGRGAVALAGSTISAAVTFGLARRRGFEPVALVLGGLVVTFYCGVLASTLVLLNEHYLVSLFIWGGGSLAQQDWSAPLWLGGCLVVLGAATALMLRPLSMLDLDDDSARAAGVKVVRIRAGGVALAIALAAAVTSAVGVVSFVGLVSPALARLAGARRFRDRLVWAPPIGAAMLWLTDAAVQWLLGAGSAFVPTGAMAAVLGSPLLLTLLPRMKTAAPPRQPAPGRPRRRAMVPLLAGMVVLAAAVALALTLGRQIDGGWGIASGEVLELVWPWRTPRLVAAIAAGIMLATAGTILQRLTGNEMASPEVMGVSAGAALGLMIALFAVATPGAGIQPLFAGGGAAVVLAVLLLVGRNSGFAPERLLLVGITLSAFLDAMVGALSATGDPRALQMLRWLAGSTYGIDTATALVTVALAGVLVTGALFSTRVLDILPLGPATGRGLGLRLGATRVFLLVLSAGLTAGATLIVGPLSFVGLMAPHIARELGLARSLPQLAGAALAGAVLMAVADWAGRTIAFPYQVPAGLVSALIGAPFLMVLLNRRSS